MRSLWINGRWIRDGKKRPSTAVVDPATEKVLDRVPNASEGDADLAVQAARQAFQSWKFTPGIERGNFLHEIARRIRARHTELARTMTLEGGKPYCENYDEVEWTAACFAYYAEIGRNARGASIPPVAPHEFNFTVKEPYGVVVCIVPWNYPLLLLSWKVAPALAAGNTVIIKPSTETPLATLELADAFSCLPHGVANILTGPGSEVGQYLVRHPGTDLIAMTGSTATGRRIGRTCGDLVKKCHLELGGKDPFLVCSDVDVKIAARAAAWAAFLNSGQ
ncbi:MAG: aldehyde dehydrogenase family protein, partial [Verrucomicrobiae bacterium]|nr:aldehyde dehydrogenase family protein [Verrucomicrobiae bacterium]